MALFPSPRKLVHLRSLWLRAGNEGSILAFDSFSNHLHLYRTYLIGILENLPEPHVLPPNLTVLYLFGSELDIESLRTLEKLSNEMFGYYACTFISHEYFNITKTESRHPTSKMF